VTKKLAPDSRTALRHVGGTTELRGDTVLGETLARAFDVDASEESAVRQHVHGFHSYPARMHPTVAARLIDALGGKGSTLLDPFCGSGTVLVEARLRGMHARGTDVNPLAIRLALLKARGVPAQQRDALVTAAKKIEEYARRRRVERAKPTVRYPEEDVALFPPHILLELDSIRDAIDRTHSKGLREDLELVLSAILTKVSKQRGDTGFDLRQRRLAPGFAAKMFVAKAEELARALEEFERAVPEGTPEVDVHADDARVLGTIKASSVDLVLTSPPYAATYDYLEHHDIRLRWLRLKIERFAALEVGARRAYARLSTTQARERWDDELGRTLSAIERVLVPTGTALIVIADSAIRAGRGKPSVPLRADEIVSALAEKAKLDVAAIASQQRPHFHSPTTTAFSGAPRREHLIALRRKPAG
jgi:DNA modification methylase